MNQLRTTTRLWTLCASAMLALVWLATPAWADPFFFSTGTPDGRLGTLSQPASTSNLETETADDFILTETTSISQATITGLIPLGTPLANIENVEIEVYHVFPKDSVDPPSGNVTARANSPADVEIDDATRDESLGTLDFSASLLNQTFSVANTVVNGINKAPNSTTLGEGPATGEEVQITITFTPPIVLPADHYFFRPEVQVTGGDFLFLSAPKPIVAPGTPFVGDLQAWIRNSDLKPDWLRIGTDIIGGTPVQTFNMAVSLAGETVAQAGTPTATATPTPTATSRPPTATPTVQPSDDGGSCSIGAAPSANRRTLWLLLAPAAVLWWTRRRRG
jgi:hypothetical protein